MAGRIQFRRGTAAAASTANRVLANGEPGYEADTGRMKIGNGFDEWDDLPYVDNPPAGGLAGHLADTTDAHDASAISVVPTGGIAATTVQAALAELDTEKATTAALTAHLDDTTDAHDASAISLTPIAALGNPANVQEALAAVPGRFAAAGHAARVNEMRLAKGGRIGVQGKGVISIRIDHGLDDFRSTFLPLLRARQIPCAFGVVSDAVDAELASSGDIYEPTTSTWTDVLNMTYQGVEIWDHSRDHRDPAPLGSSPFTIAEQIDGSRALIEAADIVPMGWQFPGITGAVTPGYNSSAMVDVNTLSRTETGQRLLANYALIEADGPGAIRYLPTEGCYMLSHITIDTMTLAAAQAWVDRAVPGIGIELMFHADWLGNPGYMSVADFTALLDYIVARRQAGAIEVLTPSGLAFADPTTTWRRNFLVDGSFEGVSKVGTAIGAWTMSATDATVTVQTGGGRTGSNFVRFAGTPATTIVSQAFDGALSAHVPGYPLEFTAWVRNTSGSAQARALFDVFIHSPGGGMSAFTTPNSVSFIIPPSSGWVPVRIPFVCPLKKDAADVAGITCRFRRFPDGTFTADLDVDDLALWPI
jgi:hypothetical protein